MNSRVAILNASQCCNVLDEKLTNEPGMVTVCTTHLAKRLEFVQLP
jgi:hypothetical protein